MRAVGRFSRAQGGIAAPTVVFLPGPPTAEADRLTDAILAARPGALVVVARS
jgi:hypothetical protein